MFNRRVEQRIGSRIPRVVAIHHRRRNSNDAHAARLAHHRSRERMRRVRLLVALRRALEIGEETSVLDLEFESRHAVVFESRLAGSFDAIEFPVVPWTDDEVAVDASVAERTADVIASTADYAELAVHERHREFVAADGDRLQRLLRRLFDR